MPAANNKGKGHSGGQSAPRRRTSGGTQRSSAARAEAAQPKAKTEVKNSGSNRRDIAGIVIIITAVILGIFIYGSSDGLLSFAAPLFKGLIGIAAYALPVLLAGFGVYLVATEKNTFRGRAVWFGFGAFCDALHIVHLFAMGDALSESYFKFISMSYTAGTKGSGGGALSAIILRGLTALLGRTGTLVLLIGLLVIMLLCVTNFSVKSIGKRIGSSHAEARRRREQRRTAIPDVDDDEDEFMPHSGKPLTAGDYEPSEQEKKPEEPEKKPAEQERKTAAHRAEHTERRTRSDDITTIEDAPAPRRRAAAYANEPADDLTLFPSSGSLSKRGRRRNRADDELRIGESFSPSDRYRFVDDTAKEHTFTEEPDISAAEAAVDTPPKQGDAQSQTPEEAAPVVDDGTEYAADDEPSAAIIEAQQTTPIVEGEPSELYEYRRPPLTLLKKPTVGVRAGSSLVDAKAKALIDTLASFGVNATMVSICEGPRIIRFEIQLAPGIRVGKVTVLKNDIGVALASSPVRIEAPIPGRTTIGIEIPSESPTPVLLREVFESDNFKNAKGSLVFALGKDITGNVITADLADMPHMLVAGTTGSGKSVCINCIILSLAYRLSPKEVRMILIDPKVVEFKVYAPLPHLFCPVVTDKNKAAGALRWAANEMDKRYKELGKYGYRKIDTYNATRENEDDRWPRIVIIIDELSDLMLVAPKDVEDSILRISQLGRASGIHIIVATQRPSVDVITGTIKSNLPAKIAFAVSRYVDSNVILDESGAETLLGHGDMIFAPGGAGKSKRIQGAFVDDSEVAAVMDFFAGSNQPAPEQDESIMRELDAITGAQGGNDPMEDEDLPAAVRVVIEKGKASASYLQRCMRIGYAKASRLMDIMEQKGYVGPQDGAKPREIYITPAMYAQIYGGEAPVTPNEE